MSWNLSLIDGPLTMKPRLAIPLAIVASLCLWAAIIKGCEALAQMPPKQYQHGADVQITFMDQDKVNWLCNMKREAGTLQACVIDGVIYAPNPCQAPGAYAELMCHEIGHANGWNAKHDG